MNRSLRLLIASIAVLLPLRASAQPLTVFAAASLNESLKEIAAAWTGGGHPAPRLAFAASSTLARQIEQGAPADLFASADQQWMDELDKKGLLAPGTRVNLLENALVLIVPRSRAMTVSIGAGFDIAGLLGPGGRLAVADPAHVPAGIYAQQSLTALGVWAQAEPRLARAQDVRGALRLVELGEAPAGIVYATDAAASDKVVVAGRLPAGSHDAITYPFALIKAGNTARAGELLTYLRGETSREIFAKHGFGVAQ